MNLQMIVLHVLQSFCTDWREICRRPCANPSKFRSLELESHFQLPLSHMPVIGVFVTNPVAKPIVQFQSFIFGNWVQNNFRKAFHSLSRPPAGVLVAAPEKVSWNGKTLCVEDTAVIPLQFSRITKIVVIIWPFHIRNCCKMYPCPDWKKIKAGPNSYTSLFKIFNNLWEANSCRSHYFRKLDLYSFEEKLEPNFLYNIEIYIKSLHLQWRYWLLLYSLNLFLDFLPIHSIARLFRKFPNFNSTINDLLMACCFTQHLDTFLKVL